MSNPTHCEIHVAAQEHCFACQAAKMAADNPVTVALAALRDASQALTELDPLAEHHNAVLLDDALGMMGCAVTHPQPAPTPRNAPPEVLEALNYAQELIKTARQYFPKPIRNSDRFQLENTCATIGKAILALTTAPELAPSEPEPIALAEVHEDHDTHRGLIFCTRCNIDVEPRLIEYGHQVTHNLQRINVAGEKIIASGWDGSSRDVSDEGEGYRFECPHCFEQYEIPKTLEIEWV